ncbi:hypothetical protein AOY11_09125 [Mycobacteroides abscessus]|nr:hypothetical protein [Mycobacteroides abscessus]ALM16389.1 hypothetical protein AOY11_09125 [Mycobacteroides abscessus]
MSFTESTSWKTLRSRPRGASAVADIDDRYAPDQMTEESYQVGGHSSTSPPRTASASGQTSSTSTDLGVVALATGDWT